MAEQANRELLALARALADYTGGTTETMPAVVFMLGGWANGLLGDGTATDPTPLPADAQAELEQAFAEATGDTDWRVYPEG